MTSTLRTIAVAGFALLIVVGCTTTKELRPGEFPPASESAEVGPSTAPEVALTAVAQLQDMPTGLISDRDRTSLFITTRSGRVLQLPISDHDGAAAPQPENLSVAVDLSDQVTTEDERGMFDIELLSGSDAAAVSYTGLDGAVTVRLLGLNDGVLSDDIVDPVVIEIPHPFGGHNGGGLAQADNGDLLLSVGDMDSRELPSPWAQEPSSLLGGIVRIPASSLEPEGPRPVAPEASLVVAKGLRNPWRIAIDPRDDSLWIGDVGQDAVEEINRLPDAGTRRSAENFGWPAYEGTAEFRTDIAAKIGPQTEPAYLYRHADDACSVSLGGIYSGAQLPALNGAMLLGDLCSNEVRAVWITAAGKEPSVDTVGAADGTIVGFGTDAFGEFYALTTAGSVLRLDPPDWTPPEIGQTASVGAPTAPEPAGPTAEECAAIKQVESMVHFTEFGPTELAVALDQLLGALRAAGATADEASAPALRTLVETYEQLHAAAEPAGFDLQDPGLQKLVSELLSGSGWASGFAGAMTDLMSKAPNCS